MGMALVPAGGPVLVLRDGGGKWNLPFICSWSGLSVNAASL